MLNKKCVSLIFTSRKPIHLYGIAWDILQTQSSVAYLEAEVLAYISVIC